MAWVSRPPGQLLLLSVFGLILREIYSAGELFGRNDWSQIMLAIVVCAWAGPYRRQALAVSTVALLLSSTPIQRVRC